MNELLMVIPLRYHQDQQILHRLRWTRLLRLSESLSLADHLQPYQELILLLEQINLLLLRCPEL